MMLSDIICLQEMRLNDSLKPVIAGYNFFFSGSNWIHSTKGIFCKTALKVSDQASSDACQYIRINIEDKFLKILSVYRSHQISASIFIETLKNQIDKYHPNVILGDFNLNSESLLYNSLKVDLLERNYRSLNHSPTHRKGSCIDYIFVSELKTHFSQFSVPYSDHDVLKCSKTW